MALPGTDVDRASRIGPGASVAHHASLRATSLGRRTSVGRYSKLAFTETGAFCSISWDVTLGAVAHPLDRATTHAFAYSARLGLADVDGALAHDRTVLGNDVWVGAGVIVLPGVHLADGAVVGAGSVVTQDVGCYEVVVGSPARTIRRRLPAELAQRLRLCAWWDWPDEALTRHRDLFVSPVDERLVEKLEAASAVIAAERSRD